MIYFIIPVFIYACGTEIPSQERSENKAVEQSQQETLNKDILAVQPSIKLKYQTTKLISSESIDVQESGMAQTDPYQQDCAEWSPRNHEFEGGYKPLSYQEIEYYKELDYGRNLDSFKTRNPALWSETKVLNSLIDLFKITRNHKFLSIILDHADFLFNHSDAAKGISDTYRKIKMFGWSSQKYNKGNYVWAVHAGEILSPILYAARIIKNDPYLNCFLGARTAAILPFAKKTAAQLLTHDFKNLSSDTKKMGAFYAPKNFSEVDFSAKPVPINMQFGAIKLLFHLYLSTKEQIYREKTLETIRFWKSTTRTIDGKLIWPYKKDGRREDAGHGSLISEGLALLYRHNMFAFKEKEMESLIKTFHTELFDAEKKAMRSHFEEPKTYDRRWDLSCDRWIELSQWDYDVFTKCSKILKKKENSSLLGKIRYLKWRK